MSVQPDEMVNPEAHRAVCEERDRLRARSPRTKIEGVACECEYLPAGVRANGDEWTVIGHSMGGWVDIEVGDGELRAPPDEAEVLASKLHWCARVARGEDVSDHDRPGLVPVEERDELVARVHDLERDLAGAVELTRRWRERCAAKVPPADLVLAQLLEQASRGVVPCGLYLRDWQRLEGVGLVEWRDGAYWATEVNRGG